MKGNDIARAGAKAILEHCLGLSEGSHLLLLLDETALEVLDPLFLASQDIDIQMTTLFYSRLQQMSLQDLPGLAKRIIEDEDAVLLAHTDATDCSRFRTSLVSKWRGSTKLGTMPGASCVILESASTMNIDFIKKQCRKLTLPLLNGHTCTVKTYDRDGNAYKLDFQIGGVERAPVQSTGLLEPHTWGNVPSGEIFTAPIESSAEGDYLVNGTIGSFMLKDDEAIVTFREGRLVQHQLRSTLSSVPFLDDICLLSEGRKDLGWNVIAEFGIGVNQGIQDVTGIILLDEKIFKTVHIAVGNNIGWQGGNQAQIHLDFVTKFPTVQIDGKTVLERGEHVVKPETFDNLADYAPPRRYIWPEWAKAAKIAKDRAYRDEQGNLLIKLASAQSGRVTEVPLANEQTRHLVSQILRWPSDRLPFRNSLTDLNREPLSPAIAHKLLSMLWAYELISPQ